MTGNRLTAIALFSTFIFSGCVIRTTSRTPSGSVRVATPSVAVNTPTVPQPTTPNVPTTSAGVMVINSSCVQGGPEECNGLDDNCDGRIDEGCGYQSGNIQVTLAWPTTADLDLYVRDPAGEEVFYKHKNSASGGVLDHDARGKCTQKDTGAPTVENIFWGMEQPPRGNYQVFVKYWDGDRCSSAAGPTTGTLSVSIGGKVQSYNFNITPGQQANVLSFNL